MDDYTTCDATELAARVRRGEVRPEELVEKAIAAVEAVNPALNAVMHPMYDAARAAAKDLPDGPFRGVPMVVKDHDGFIKGEPYTAGTSFLEGFVPDHDSEALARLRRAGLVFVAKTNLPELALLGTTEGRLKGPARNPWNTEHSTGGSSGGSAALVAARAVPLGHGGDGGGSLRIPASACGLVGFKTTRGRITQAPDFGESWGGYVSWGCMTRSVRDAAAIVDVMAGSGRRRSLLGPAARAPARRGGRGPSGEAPGGLHRRLALRQGDPPRSPGGRRVRRPPARRPRPRGRGGAARVRPGAPGPGLPRPDGRRYGRRDRGHGPLGRAEAASAGTSSRPPGSSIRSGEGFPRKISIRPATRPRRPDARSPHSSRATTCS